MPPDFRYFSNGSTGERQPFEPVDLSLQNGCPDQTGSATTIVDA
jgi:hypothetical protein